MKSVKRGMLLVVVLVILMSFWGLAPSEDGSPPDSQQEQGPSAIKYQVVSTPIIDCDTALTLPVLGITTEKLVCDYGPHNLFRYDLDIAAAYAEYDFCDEEVRRPWSANQHGCNVVVTEKDPGPNDCGTGLLNPGFWFNNIPQKIAGGLIEGTWAADTDDGPDFVRDNVGFTFLGGEGVICADDSLWYKCTGYNSKENSEGTVVSAGGESFVCGLLSKEDPLAGFVWRRLGEDKDHDGYNSFEDGDCGINPADDPEICSEIMEQVDFTSPDFQGLTVEGLRDKVRGLCNNKDYPQKYSQCAICINPGAPEVCGDKVNNDCGGPDLSFPEDITNLEGETDDDCNKYQEGCIQDGVYVGEKKLEQPSRCSISKEECSEDDPCPEEAGNCDPPDQPDTTEAGKNIYNEEFSWIDSVEEGGFCCGYNGVKDLGEVRTQKGGEGNFICLNKNLVGTEPDKDGKDRIGDLLGGDSCGDNWCWVNAISVQTKFQIVTVRKPGEEPFDVVSNNNDWFVCKAEGTIADPGITDEYQDDLIKTHRFYCYDEGNRWSLAECTDKQDQRRNYGIKGRYGGDSLFSLPLVNDPTPDVEGDKVPIDPEREGEALSFFSKWYKDFYPDYHFLDFSDYDYFNFMVKFVDEELKLPVGINLKIEGPDDENGDPIVYFDGEVLGYVQNGPFFDKDNYMHIRVPIGDYKAVKKFAIGPRQEPDATTNKLKVRNIYLSKEGTNPLCSGDDSANMNSWLTDIDQGDQNKDIKGDKLCENLYGKIAWLGMDDEVEEDSANCCGNNPNEYYAGSSKVCDPTDKGCKEARRYGCWNSQPIASGKTIMNVEFDVTAYEPEYSVSYDPIELPNVENIKWRILKADAVEPYEADDYGFGDFPCASAGASVLNPGENFKILCPIDLTSAVPPGYRGKATFWFKDINNELAEVYFYDAITNEPVGKSAGEKGVKDKYGNLIVKGSAQYLEPEEAARLWNRPLAVVMALRENEYFPVKGPIGPTYKAVTKTINYSCSGNECLFPLPGSQPYQITNKHPELYELYFITDKDPKETLITKKDQSFGAYGNIKAKKVSQQVLFYNNEDDADNLPGFYGCQAASFLENVPASANFNNKLSCSVVDGMFCSPSVTVRPDDDLKERYTTINSWSYDKIEKVGYNTEGFLEPTEEQNISEYYQELELTLKDNPFGPEKRNHTAVVLPARNFISNAEFTTSGKELPHWEILHYGGEFVDDERKYAKEGKVTLNGEKLRSERVAVPPAANVHFSQAQECKVEVSLVDKDGNSQPAALPEFNTGKASYAIIEFTGPCDVEKPILQLVDEFGAAEYSKKPLQEMPDTFDARAGVACCPDGFCWNGYACAAPMSKFTTLTEHIADGRDYRCIDGQWKKAVFKFDWNNQKWGFCPQQDQCFVLGSGEEKYTAKDLDYEGKFPICIGDSEYIFDNYCQKGNWTSRTKFVATKLLEVAENNEFVLYCSPYNDTFLDLENKENYLGGDVPKGVTEKPKDPTKKTETKVIPTCFKIQDPQIKGLLKDDQNTCINNVCVLKYKEGGQFKVAFATTLNRPIDDPKSFLFSLDLPKDACKQGQGSDFMECDLSSLGSPNDADLYYSQKLNAVIYTKEGLKLSPGVVDKVLKWFDNLFGGIEPSKEKQFIDQAQIFRDLYLLKKDNKKVRALQEVFPGVRQTLVAEYQNFKTPVCDYVKNIKVPPELETELLEKVTGVEKISCTVNGTVQKVAVNAGLDFFWPQLTGKLRVNE